MSELQTPALAHISSSNLRSDWELTAAPHIWVQSFHVENAGIRDMLQDIAIEEFSHLEMVGKLIAQHTSEL